VSAQSLPPRPNLDHLKRQAKELLDEWRATPPEGRGEMRLRDAQRAIAERYGFTSWDALRAHVERTSGVAATQPRRRGMDYDDPVPDVVEVHGPITRDVALRLADEGVAGVKLASGAPPNGFAHLTDVPSLTRIDLSGRDDLVDDDVAFIASMPWVTAVSLAGCSRLTDRSGAYLRDLRGLEQVNLKWTALGDDAIAALAGKRNLRRLVAGARMSDAGAALLREIPGLADPSDADSFLSISSARTLTDAALAHIGSLQGVAALDVHMSVFGSPHYTAKGVAHLKQMGALQELNFHGNLATDAVLREIAQIRTLRNLHCQDIVSGEEGFIALGRCATLESLGARTCVRIGPAGFAALMRLPRLKHVSIGGPLLAGDGWSPVADAAALVDLNPIRSDDAAFAYIAKAPRLERLTNVYNRSTGDGATRHLRGHTRLTHYSAFGTQITDESLRILAELPNLESLEFENCAFITDEGLRALARLPRLRKVSAWSCLNVAGAWIDDVPAGVEKKTEAGPPGQVEGYRAETLLDYPDLAIPADVPRLHAPSPARRALAALVPMGVRAEWTADGLQVSLEAGVDPRWVSAITETAFDAPVRIELVVRPLTMLKLGFGGHNRFVGFDEHGALRDLAPWFLKTDQQKGRRHDPSVLPAFTPEVWVGIALEVDGRGARIFVNGTLRHTWDGDFSRMRGRVAVGLPESGVLTLRELRTALPS
jgi:hypothetical protein